MSKLKQMLCALLTVCLLLMQVSYQRQRQRNYRGRTGYRRYQL